MSRREVAVQDRGGIFHRFQREADVSATYQYRLFQKRPMLGNTGLITATTRTVNLPREVPRFTNRQRNSDQCKISEGYYTEDSRANTSVYKTSRRRQSAPGQACYGGRRSGGEGHNAGIL